MWNYETVNTINQRSKGTEVEKFEARLDKLRKSKQTNMKKIDAIFEKNHERWNKEEREECWNENRYLKEFFLVDSQITVFKYYPHLWFVGNNGLSLNICLYILYT